MATPLTLNGAQIDSARAVMADVAAGTLATVAAIELLVAVGIPRKSAETMVAEQSRLPKTAPQIAETKPPANTKTEAAHAV